jgi:hypothetical protein
MVADIRSSIHRMTYVISNALILINRTWIDMKGYGVKVTRHGLNRRPDEEPKQSD